MWTPSSARWVIATPFLRKGGSSWPPLSQVSHRDFSCAGQLQWPPYWGRWVFVTHFLSKASLCDLLDDPFPQRGESLWLPSWGKVGHRDTLWAVWVIVTFPVQVSFSDPFSEEGEPLWPPFWAKQVSMTFLMKVSHRDSLQWHLPPCWRSLILGSHFNYHGCHGSCLDVSL